MQVQSFRNVSVLYSQQGFRRVEVLSDSEVNEHLEIGVYQFDSHERRQLSNLKLGETPDYCRVLQKRVVSLGPRDVCVLRTSLVPTKPP